VRLSDELEAEFHEAVTDAQGRAAEHGEQLRAQWDGDGQAVTTPA
jgi:hypothetical protein